MARKRTSSPKGRLISKLRKPMAPPARVHEEKKYRRIRQRWEQVEEPPSKS
jgi:hypothetical protein